MENKYAIYVVDSNEEDFNKFNTNYQEVKDLAIDVEKRGTLNELLEIMTKGINGGEFSDMNWYFITDENEGIILFS
jgi:hypothetical protein